jgi:hypothetical protein
VHAVGSLFWSAVLAVVGIVLHVSAASICVRRAHSFFAGPAPTSLGSRLRGLLSRGSPLAICTAALLSMSWLFFLLAIVALLWAAFEWGLTLTS